MGDEGARTSEIINKLQEELTAMKNERAALSAEKGKLEQSQKHYVKRLEQAETNERKAIDRVQNEWREFKKKQDNKLAIVMKEIREKEKELRPVEQVRRHKEEAKQEFQELKLSKKSKVQPLATNSPLFAEQRVEVEGIDKKATITKDWDPQAGGAVSVEINGMKMTLPRNKIVRIVDPVTKKAKSSGRIKYNVSEHETRHEIKLLGKNVEEAVSELEKFFDEALINGLTRLKIVHGIGTGALKTGIDNFLKKQSFVKGWHHPEQEQGGKAVTIVELNS